MDLERARLKVILATVVINITAVIALAFVPWSDWRTGMALNLIDNLLLIGFALRFKDRFLMQLMLFGFLVGFTELAADAWLVDYTRTLDYSIGGGPMIWRSPLWMPFAWEIVAVQFGYIGLILRDRFKGMGLLLVGILGAINIPFYEEMALKINWWAYRDCRMFLHTPYYIIGGEFLIAIALAVLTGYLRRDNLKTTIWAGIAGGVAIFAAYVIGYFLLK